MHYLFRHQLPCQLRLGNRKNCASVDEQVMTGLSACSVVFQRTTLPTASWQREKLHNDKKSKQVELFWDLQTKREALHIEAKIFEEEAQLRRKELREKLRLEETRQILDATQDIRKQDRLLRERTTKIIEMHPLGDLESEQPEIGQKRRYEEELPSTPTRQINKTDVDRQKTPKSCDSSESDSEIVPTLLTNVFLATSNELEVDRNKTDESGKLPAPIKVKSRTPKYITRDIADEVLKTYRMSVLAGDKLIHNNVDILDLHTKAGVKKSPLSIGVINIHNPSCTKFLPKDFMSHIAGQIEDPAIKSVDFAIGRSIQKFMVECSEDVLAFLDKFGDIRDLTSLGRCLDANPINMSEASNDLIYARTLFEHFYLLYKNDILLQPMSENEYNAYIWTPILRNAFLSKDDLKLSCGELASKSYDKLKDILDIASRSAPKLDGKGFLKSLGTEVLAQEDGTLNTNAKRTGDLGKLEFCLKVILTTLYLALPSAVKNSITDIETYTLQSNGFRLKISASKYLFEDTIISMDLQHVEVPKTVEGFSKLVVGAKVILSWKARTRKNIMTFHEALNKGHKRLTNGVFFSPVKVVINSDVN
ncbi:8289_t:CDS:2 [Paraglomus occultum]|uniref:8289_t:CDS:1 n=1 Tax=Paraglomus occultum TaxID=144539 RepID=A0A9N8WL63_9GLOM|nr:8289_t:CDS:2 [Paraglomus occultum]